MTSTLTSTGTSYAKGYAKGRRAALDYAAPTQNPYRPGSSSYHGWNDGHYDARSARRLEVERHSAQLWSQDGAN